MACILLLLTASQSTASRPILDAAIAKQINISNPARVSSGPTISSAAAGGGPVALASLDDAASAVEVLMAN